MSQHWDEKGCSGYLKPCSFNLSHFWKWVYRKFFFSFKWTSLPGYVECWLFEFEDIDMDHVLFPLPNLSSLFFNRYFWQSQTSAATSYKYEGDCQSACDTNSYICMIALYVCGLAHCKSIHRIYLLSNHCYTYIPRVLFSFNFFILYFRNLQRICGLCVFVCSHCHATLKPRHLEHSSVVIVEFYVCMCM